MDLLKMPLSLGQCCKMDLTLGGGFEIVLSCDMIVASESA